MADIEDMLGKILSDPTEMEKISRMAAQLLGGDGAPAQEEQGPDISALLKKVLPNAGQGSDKAALVAALGPFLQPQRRAKLEKALRISRMARLAGLAMEEGGYV